MANVWIKRRRRKRKRHKLLSVLIYIYIYLFVDLFLSSMVCTNLSMSNVLYEYKKIIDYAFELLGI